MRRLLLPLVAAAALAACGGGRDEMPAPPAATDKVPASALASARAYTGYVGSLAASDTAAPLDVEGLMPPVSDTDEPDDL